MEGPSPNFACYNRSLKTFDKFDLFDVNLIAVARKGSCLLFGVNPWALPVTVAVTLCPLG